MNRLVYLFELDSVNKCDLTEDAGVANTPAMKALFNEIINNGNCVAISMNQLTDSQFIKEMLEDEFAYSSLLKLFENGAIKVSLYDHIQSASHYVQNAIEKCLSDTNDTFIFSNLPIKTSETQLLTEVHNALKFSNLSIIHNMQNTAPEDEKDRLQLICRFVNVILQVSICNESYILPKQSKKRTLEDFLMLACDILQRNAIPGITEKDQIVNYLSKLHSTITDGKNNRSNWLNYSDTDSHILIANKIINICYNYTIEDSINGISKHYNDNDFYNSFEVDFINRLQLSLSSDKKNNIKSTIIQKSQWKTLVRFSEYIKNLQTIENRYLPTENLYEKDFQKERKKWILFIARQNLHSVLLSVLYIFLFAAIELCMDYIKGVVSSILISALLLFFTFSLFGSLLWRVIKKWNHDKDFPDILEGFINVVLAFYDIFILLGAKNDSYRLS